MDMDIKQQQHHQHQHHETAASMHDFNTDLVEGNNGDVDGDGGDYRVKSQTLNPILQLNLINPVAYLKSKTRIASLI